MTGGESWEEYQEDFGSEFPDDEMPKLDPVKLRVFSETLAKAAVAPADIDDPDDWIQQALEFGVLDWKEVRLPPGFVLAEGGPEVCLPLDLGRIGRKLLDAHFAAPERFGYPFNFDLHFGWYLDFPNYPSGFMFAC